MTCTCLQAISPWCKTADSKERQSTLHRRKLSFDKRRLSKTNLDIYPHRLLNHLDPVRFCQSRVVIEEFKCMTLI